MKKIKILEKSRLLNNQEMDELQGGAICLNNTPYSGGYNQNK